MEGQSPKVSGHRKASRKAGGGRVTMTDIAKAAGCSQATVSFVLNNTPGIKLSPQTRERVVEAARSLGYRLPAAMGTKASSPATMLDGVIGFVVDQLATSPEAVVAIEGARQASWNAGTVVLVAQTMNDPVMEPRAIEALRAEHLSGLVYMTIFTREIAAPAFLYEMDVPVVLLNCYTADYAFPAVVPSEIAGG